MLLLYNLSCFAGIYYSDPKGRPKQSIRQLDVKICITGKISVQAKQPTNVRWLLVQAIISVEGPYHIAGTASIMMC